MSAAPMFEVRSEPDRNLARVRYFGHVTAAGLKACADEVARFLPEMRPGFTVLTDLSALDAMDLDGLPHLTRIMDLSREHGVGTVIRVIPNRERDIGFNILSIIHYRRQVKVITCDTLAEAERVLERF